MKSKLTKVLLVGTLLSMVLASCGGNGDPKPKPPPDASLFTAANAWDGSAPSDATTLTPDEFQAKVKSGEIELITAQDLKGQEQTWRDQYVQDQAFLKAIPADQRSPDVEALLNQTPDLPMTPGGDYIITVKNNDGTTFNTITLGKQSQMRQIVESFKQASSSENALAAYQAAYDASPADIQGKISAPSRLSGQPVSTIMNALDNLDDALASVANLDNTRIEPQSLTPQSGPGNGVDTAGICTPSNAGITKNFWWPLKRFTTPVKQQGMRGSCWGFAAVAALESREMVVHDQTLNLSEQYIVNKNKRNYAPSDFSDGYSAAAALNNMLNHNDKIPSEGAWTYNQSYGRPSTAFDAGVAGTAASYKNACSNYSGYCSETAHQSPRSCTSFLFITYCAYNTVTNVGGGVDGSATTEVWNNAWSTSSAHTRRSHFPVNTIRVLLASGQPLLASFGVFPGWDGAGASGFVTNYSSTGGRGGHVVLMTGFISNATLAQRLPSAPAGAGGGYFIIKNSWGCGAADAGYYYVPVDYVTKFFSNLTRMNMTTSRSARWNTEVVQGKGSAGPQVSLTAPFTFSGGFHQPFYFNFQKLQTFSARVNDATDGQDCCSSSLEWFSAKAGANKIASGKTVNLNLAGSGASDTITTKAKDSDGNVGQISFMVYDGGYPIVTVLYPQQGSTLPLKTPTLLQANAVQFLGGGNLDTALNCAGMTWKSSKAGEGPWTGCTPSVSFATSGPRTLTASQTYDGRTDSKTVSVTVAEAPTPPTPTVVVTITAPKLPYSVGTYGSSVLVDFAGSVTLNGVSASCATLTWKAVSATKTYTGTGCAPKIDLNIGVYTVTVTYTNGSGQGSASGTVTIVQKIVG
ncbi:hypothetical protein EHF33_05790 [Deinococcus psychrotolerans]|uniref:Peptidase C1A papain C-terminal domain-containing protein n=1 Tax=Deinococcus psychrotolerans TaxID=2489213 RepID=A0A3G8YBM2_9DEIO|nr:C1 family peptidase [Deinococcus psychrotolerans]AZI42323.1 hypothetical protein EHF33_05790 [Deinococcus psychrotolerans]